jgi:hypothetical protein
MRKTLKIIFALIFTAILFIACSEEDNPVVPDPGNGGDPDPIVINTPKKMIIEQIRVVGFPENKSNGNPWDYNPILPLTNRPDVFVELSINSNNTEVFKSKTEQDAYYLASYTYTEASSSNDPNLPYSASMSTKYKLEVWDKDGLVNDIMTTYTFTPEDFYNDDNAVTFSINRSSGGVGIRVYGTWEY